MSETYTTHGSARGGCGHDHQSRTAAWRCVSRDRRRCRQQGGYSDRIVHTSTCRAVATVGTEPCSCGEQERHDRGAMILAQAMRHACTQ